MNFLNFPIFPPQASTYAERVDPLYYTLCISAFVLTVAILTGMIVLGIVFRKKEGVDRPSKPLESPLLEITWTIVPTIAFLAAFVWGVVLYADYRTPPDGALDIDIVGKQWMWRVQHANGMREINQLHVPVGRPVKLNMTSQDVVHSYYVPAFRVKNDVIPGRFTMLWFEATKVGEYPIFCAEYCGTEHSYMRGTVTVMKPEDYAVWLEGGPKNSPVEAGEFLFSQLGCATCHTGASGARCPDLTGVYGSTGLMTSGDEVLKDEDYLFESIMDSGRRIVDGYTALMPNFSNQLDPEDANNLIAYIKSLGGEEPEAAAAAL